MFRFLKAQWLWLVTLFSGSPHVYIGGKENPYLKRWYLIPKNPLFGLFLHKFERDDDDRALHSHPWRFITIVLSGKYHEWQYGATGLLEAKLRGPGSVGYRPASTRHRVTLVDNKPCWTLIVVGPKEQEWGFFCPQGFVHWSLFCDPNDDAKPGKGCDQ